MRKTVQSCFRDGSSIIKLVTEKEEREQGSWLWSYKESYDRLLVRDGLSPFIVQLDACENALIGMSASTY